MTLLGPDGSHHQEGMQVGESTWTLTGFMLWRASIGRRIDRTYWTWREAARRHDVPFCAYHFVYPIKSYPAAEQANTFAIAEPDESVPVMLDWESDGTLAPTFTDVLEVAEAIRSRGYEVPLLYTGRWYWSQKGSPTIAGHGFELVNSNYGNQNPAGEYEPLRRYVELGGDKSARWEVSYGGLSPSIWQYGSRIAWGDRYMDMNAVREHACVDRCFKHWTQTPPPQPPGDDDMTPQEVADAVWNATKRTDPVTNDSAAMWEVAMRARIDANNAIKEAAKAVALCQQILAGGGSGSPINLDLVAKAVADELHVRLTS